MSELTRKEKELLLFGFRCHSAPEVESTFIIMATKIKHLERQLEEVQLKLSAEEEKVRLLNKTAESYFEKLEEAKEELDLAVKHLPTKKKLEFIKYLKEKGDENANIQKTFSNIHR